MHELSIALGLIDLAIEEAARQGSVRIAALHLRIGSLSGVVPEALRFSFDLAAAGTPVAGARLEIEDIPVTVHCPACDEDHGLTTTHRLCCPLCDGPAQVIRGRELEFAAMEVIDGGG